MKTSVSSAGKPGAAVTICILRNLDLGFLGMTFLGNSIIKEVSFVCIFLLGGRGRGRVTTSTAMPITSERPTDCKRRQRKQRQKAICS